MIRFDQWWLPDGEAHLPEWMRQNNRVVDGRLTYQYHKYEGVLTYCPPARRRVAVDVGAHVGLWSHWMARDFSTLQAFEPSAVNRACWCRNVATSQAVLHPYALGDQAGQVRIAQQLPGSSGSTAVSMTGDDVEVRTLDSFQFSQVDFLKIDCEGYEVFVLEGARETLARCRPVVLVEQKPTCGSRYGRDDRAACILLELLGAELRWSRGGDYCYTFPEAG